MGTSKSSRKSSSWTGRAFVFAGRPDPSWPLHSTTAVVLENLWQSLPRDAESPTAAPILGYRGCSLHDADGREWFAFGGVVKLQANGQFEVRRDDNRDFEKTLLASAPKGALPPSVRPLTESA